MTDRGAEAYIQAYLHIASGGLFRTRRGRRRAAMRYLLLTATPPLTDREQASARDQMHKMRKDNT